MAKTVVSLFDDFDAARRAVRDLVDSGFSRDSISFVANTSTAEYNRYTREQEHRERDRTDENDIGPEEGAGIGAGIGAGVGGLGGLLMGLGVLAIPGVGPALAAGPIISTLVGAGIGAVAGGIAGALVNMGVPEEEAGNYAEGVRRGGTLVAVTTADNRVDDAVNILDRYDPVDIDERAQEWRSRGWTGYDADAKPYSRDEIEAERTQYPRTTRETTTREAPTTMREGETTLPVTEEELQVGKRSVSRGGVRVRSYVTEHPVEEQVNLRQEHVDVERRKVDQPVSESDMRSRDMRPFEERTIEMTETAEEPVVAKRSRLVEEVVVRKDVGERTETVGDTVRRTDVDVEQIEGEQTRAVGDTGFHTYETDFHNHYSSNFANSGYSYDDYAPVYNYGYTLGTNERYRGRNWSQVEPDARRYWEERNPGTWDRFKDTVRYAWERSRSR